MSNKFLSSTPQELQESLNELNRKMAEEEAQAQAGSLSLPYIDLHNFPVDLVGFGYVYRGRSQRDGRRAVL